MSLRVVLLTTDATHHVYYARRLAERYPPVGIIVETRLLTAPFETLHPFEERRDEYERELLLAGSDDGLAEVAPTYAFESANDALGMLRNLAPDIVLVFGTGKLLPPVLQVPATACLNLHGGNPEEYRGLDTHLWAIYHSDFANLVTTLHHLDAELDCGDIAGRKTVPITRGMGLHELRARNTQTCVELSITALEETERTGSARRRAQQSRGRYYSFMPAVLKDACVRNFERHVATL